MCMFSSGTQSYIEKASMEISSGLFSLGQYQGGKNSITKTKNVSNCLLYVHQRNSGNSPIEISKVYLFIIIL